MNFHFPSAKTLSIIIVAILAPDLAHAYLDPGTGSMLLQIILGGLAGLAVAIKLYWHRVLRLFGINRKRQSDQQEPAESDPKEA